MHQEALPKADLQKAALQEAGAWQKVAERSGSQQEDLLADNLLEVLQAMGIWDSEEHQLWLWELQQLSLEQAGEIEDQEEDQEVDHLAMLADQVSELHLLTMQKFKTSTSPPLHTLLDLP